MTYYYIILPSLFLVTRIISMHGEDWVWCFAKAHVQFCEPLKRSVYFKPPGILVLLFLFLCFLFTIPR